MLKLETDFIREFPVSSKTDRDAEAVLLIEYIKELAKEKKIESLLDIGAHYSATQTHYANQIRPFVTRYDGIDILDDPVCRQLLDNYYVGNAIGYPYDLKSYDTVICVSTIEHAGVSTYKGDHVMERMKLFEACLSMAKKHLWISFPVGQEYTYPGELSVITDKQLKRWETLTSNFKVKERFFYTQGAQAGHPWREHTKREVAVKIPYIDFIGNQSIGVLEVTK